MTGKLTQNNSRWYINYLEGNDNYIIDVQPGRLDELSKIGTSLVEGDVVNFRLLEVPNFPYRYAVPYFESGPAEAVNQKKFVKKKEVEIMLSGFPEDEITIKCDGFDVSSSGYWYFYNNSDHNGREVIGYYPVGRTAITSVKIIEVEVN